MGTFGQVHPKNIPHRHAPNSPVWLDCVPSLRLLSWVLSAQYAALLFPDVLLKTFLDGILHPIVPAGYDEGSDFLGLELSQLMRVFSWLSFLNSGDASM